MKKLTIFALLIMLLAACSSPQDTSKTENEEQVNETEETEEVEDETVEEQDVDSQEPDKETESTNTESDSNASTEENNSQEANEGNVEEDLVALTKKIFTAQNNYDYDFLASVLSKGSKLDKENNKFIFENVTYPHEQELLTEENAGNLEFRYTHENNPDSMIVGFAAIDYENESSYVIDFEFIREDGKWKMNDMDINK